MLEQSTSRLENKLDASQNGSVTFQEYLDLFTISQDLLSPFLQHPMIEKALSAKRAAVSSSTSPFPIETQPSDFSPTLLWPMIESLENSKKILFDKVCGFFENGFSLSGKSLHDPLDLQVACQLIEALDKK